MIPMIPNYKVNLSYDDYLRGDNNIYLIDFENNIKSLEINSFIVNNNNITCDLSYFDDLSYFGDYDLLNYINFIILSNYDGVKYLYEPIDIHLTKRNDHISYDSNFSNNHIVLSFGIKSEIILDELIFADPVVFSNLINSFRRDIKLKELGL